MGKRRRKQIYRELSGQYDNPQVHRWEQHSKRFKGDPTINYLGLPFGYDFTKANANNRVNILKKVQTRINKIKKDRYEKY